VSTITREVGVDDYVAAVAARLGPERAAEHRELLDELAEHLAEAGAEAEGDDAGLEARLGTPEAYATEFLASAGIALEPPAPAAPPPLRQRADHWLGAARERADRARLVELEPAGWVIRGWGLLALATELVRSNADHDVFPIPRLVPNDLVGVVLLAAAVALSVRVGRGDRRWPRHLVTVAGLVGIALALGHGNTAGASSDSCCASAYGPGLQSSGSEVTNIWAYGPDGQRLDHVLLFDQNGQPLEVSTPPAPGEPSGSYPRQVPSYDYDPQTGQQVQGVEPPPFESLPVAGTAPTTTMPVGDPSTASTVATLPAGGA
jgi:hypothetical protein